MIWMKKKVVYLVASFALFLSITACDDELGVSSSQPEEQQVSVSLSLGFADEEDGYPPFGTADTRSGDVLQDGAFCAQPSSGIHAGTRTGLLTKPEKLYELRILQYDRGGTLKKSQSFAGATDIGGKLTVSLNVLDDCQLVIVACGEGNGSLLSSISVGSNISALQKLTMDKSYFDAIPTDGTTSAGGININKMPYILHLPHVNVTASGIQSVEGAHDARLLLKRLATKLTVAWNNNLTDPNYALKEVRLCQLPAVFRLLPAPTQTEWGMTYPSAIVEFIDYFRLTDDDLLTGSKTIWVPANARGTSATASSPYYRTKENAPDAASYAEVVVDNSVRNERLYYRAYLGGDASTDFNLLENTDYTWTLNINSTNYRGDNRIQLLDQSPVVSTNIVPTSNCLMMLPGTNICFNPYKHEAGTDGWNNELISDGELTTDKTIASVKVLWQTKDAGTSGDLVMGYVVDDENHTNLVNVSDITDKDNALVHIRVPVTNGGNAVLAAYNASNKIVWSWHIWISDYVPTPMKGNIDASTRSAAIEAAQNATQGGYVQVYGGISWTDPQGAFYKCVIMDRHLGATKAGIQSNLLDRIRTFGLLYQGGRKDPFFSTADGSAVEVKTIYDGYGNILEITKPGQRNVPYQTLIENPSYFYRCRPDGSLNETLYSDKTNTWGTNGKKTIYDPCPTGWKVPTNDYNSKGVLYSLCAGFGSTNNSAVYENSYGNNDNIYYFNGTALTSMKTNGGESKNGTDIPGSGFLYIGGSGESIDSYSGKSAFFPGVSLRETNTGLYRTSVKNNAVFLWTSTNGSGVNGTINARYIYQIQTGLFSFQHTVSSGYGFSVRCIQDNEQ